MKTKTKKILAVLKVVSWIIFIALCIQTGVIIFTFIYSFFNPAVAHNLHLGLDLSALYNADIGNYALIVSSLILLSALKAFIFYLVVKIFLTINFQSPFKIEVASLIARIGYVAIAVWILSVLINAYVPWLVRSGMEISEVNLQNYRSGGAEFFFLGIIVFVISQIFKRGIELESEHELTI